VRADIIKVVADKIPATRASEIPVKIIKDEVSPKPIATPPERIGDPAIQVIVIRRRGVVCHDGRPFIVIIIVYCCLVGIDLCAFRG